MYICMYMHMYMHMYVHGSDQFVCTGDERGNDESDTYVLLTTSGKTEEY
jgi:hypothetical protein